MWIGFTAILLAALLVDLAVFGRKPHEISLRAAAAWSALWIGLSLAFALWIGLHFGSRPAVEFLSGYLIEKSLSIDNLFVFVLIFEYFHVSSGAQHRVLAWGIFGALAMRGGLIAAGEAFITAFSWSFYIFGGFLIYASLHILFRRGKPKGLGQNRAIGWISKIIPTVEHNPDGKFFVRENGRRVATTLLLALIAIESADLLFAVDSLPAVFGVTRDPFIVFSSNACAVLGLRALYFVLAGWITRLRHLASGVAVVLLFIGCKMIVAHWIEVPAGVTLAVIGVVLGVAALASVFAKPATSESAERERPVDETTKRSPDLAAAPIAELVALLDSTSREPREAAARELFRRGRAAAEQAVASWRADSQIAPLISPHATAGIAVAPQRFVRIRAVLAQPRLAEVPPDQDAQEFEWNLDPETHLDILTTRDSSQNGAIAKFLAKFGEGIQQVEFLTPDVDSATRLLASRLSVSPVYPATRAGADGTRVNFFLCSTPAGGKILIELVEAKS